jgi:2-C-methyl-D-erythritol 4-phosphate cytidylyltransferase/2-C-methyl-D-erythritol 2,4-cyclodiphosphate synthase
MDDGPASSAKTQVWAVVVAAGTGSRFGGAKQYAPLAGRRVIDWALAGALRAAPGGVVLVVPPDRLEVDEPAASRVVAGGRTRSESVRAGLGAVPETAQVIAVHDAARPLAGAQLWDAVLEAVFAGADGAVPGVPVADTLRRVEGDEVVGTVARDGLVGVQTPQAFRADILRAAHDRGGEATDDATLVEAAGGRVVVVPGDPANAKITTEADLVAAEARGGEFRVGHGFDSHARDQSSTGPLVLGGVAFPDEPALAGHSDGDAVAHAVADSLLGAAGLGDIGAWFPDTDPALAGADSVGLLRQVVHALGEHGWRVVSVDCTVVCERPRLAERRDEMVRVLGAAVGAPVSIKGKRPEGLSGLVDAGTVCCWAVATVAGPGAARP